MGRPREKNISKWGHWKRAQRDHPTGKGRNFVHHHTEGVLNNPNKMVVLSRSEHAKVDNPMKKAIKGRLSSGRKAA